MLDREELSQLRFIASSSRPLVRERVTTELSAVDFLQRTGARWEWLRLALVCKDGTEITEKADVSEAMRAIKVHGGVVGIVGAAFIDREFRFLKKPLVKETKYIKVKATLERSVRATERLAHEAVRESIRRVFLEGGTKVIRVERKTQKD